MNIYSWLIGAPYLVAGFKCDDGRVVDVVLNHIHVQDFSGSFRQNDKQTDLIEALHGTTETLFGEFGAGKYSLTLVDSTDKNNTIHDPTRDNKYCDHTYFTQLFNTGEDLQVANARTKAIIKQNSNYWGNNQRPDLLDALYYRSKLHKAPPLEEGESPSSLTVFTVGTDQCANESCYYSHNEGFNELQGCNHNKFVDKELAAQYARGENRNMGGTDCQASDYPTMEEVALSLKSAEAKVLWLVYNDQAKCQDIGKHQIKDYYKERIVPGLEKYGVVSKFMTVKDDLAIQLLDGMKDIICVDPVEPEITTTTPKPTTPSTEEPITPSTEEPITPSTEEPITPSTEEPITPTTTAEKTTSKPITPTTTEKDEEDEADEEDAGVKVGGIVGAAAGVTAVGAAAAAAAYFMKAGVTSPSGPDATNDLNIQDETELANEDPEQVIDIEDSVFM